MDRRRTIHRNRGGMLPLRRSAWPPGLRARAGGATAYRRAAAPAARSGGGAGRGGGPGPLEAAALLDHVGAGRPREVVHVFLHETVHRLTVRRLEPIGFAAG